MICQREDGTSALEENCDINTKPSNIRACNVQACPISDTIRLIHCVPTSYAQNKWINNPYKYRVNMKYAWLNCDWNLKEMGCISDNDGCIIWFSDYNNVGRTYDNCVATSDLVYGYLPSYVHILRKNGQPFFWENY